MDIFVLPVFNVDGYEHTWKSVRYVLHLNSIKVNVIICEFYRGAVVSIVAAQQQTSGFKHAGQLSCRACVGFL